jgi:hypothetical protein
LAAAKVVASCWLKVAGQEPFYEVAQICNRLTFERESDPVLSEHSQSATLRYVVPAEPRYVFPWFDAQGAA